MDDKPNATWETGPRCKTCKHFMRSQGCTWVDEHTFYFYLKCGYCGQRLRGKKKSVEAYVVDWQGWESMQVKPREVRRNKAGKKYMTARRKGKKGK